MSKKYIDLSTEWSQNILRNVKQQHPELATGKWPDVQILREYDDYIMSDVQDDYTFQEWMEDTTPEEDNPNA